MVPTSSSHVAAGEFIKKRAGLMDVYARETENALNLSQKQIAAIDDNSSKVGQTFWAEIVK